LKKLLEVASCNASNCAVNFPEVFCGMRSSLAAI
jgi:hypothetical protein